MSNIMRRGKKEGIKKVFRIMMIETLEYKRLFVIKLFLKKNKGEEIELTYIQKETESHNLIRTFPCCCCCSPVS